MSQITVTLAQIKKLHPCSSRFKILVKSLGGIKKYGKDTPITFEQIIKSNGIKDALWVLKALDHEHSSWIRHFAVDCAESVKEYMTDKRSLDALRVAREYADGCATDDKHERILAAAQAAAWAAKTAAWAAKDAAMSDADAAAAAAAWDAAVDVAISAADANAWDAADAAAWAVAWAATRAAVVVAMSDADAAARAAAWSAAWAAMDAAMGDADAAAMAAASSAVEAAKAAAWDAAVDVAMSDADAAARAAAWASAWTARDNAWAAIWTGFQALFLEYTRTGKRVINAQEIISKART